jgi:penicillin amidase
MRSRKILRVASVAALLLAAAAAGSFLWLRSRGLPQRQGVAALAGLTSAVEVRFDRAGVPTIQAGSALDAFAALGWLHANDRLFQMEMSRRAAAGRLSELFGGRALKFDQRMRRLRFRRVAEAALEHTSPDTRRALEAYAAGVNAWLAERGDDLPPEFVLLRHRPEPWVPADTLAFVQMMARSLSPIDDPPENDYFAFLRAFGGERARELAGDPGATLFEEVAALAGSAPSAGARVGAQAEAAGLGSNSWAVAPGRSAAGHALVANDPHLDLGLPNVWYQVAIRAPDYQASGMSFPGTPTVTIGRGPHLAWGFTNLYVDDVDVFLEELDPSGTQVRRGDGWTPIARQVETIRVKDGAAVEVEAKTTDRGVFLDADPEAGLPARSVAWTGYEPGDQFAAVLALARCGSVAEVPAAIAPWVFPGQNLVAADAAGHLLWTPIGQAPARFGWDGRFPAPGSRLEVGWNGLVPAARNPVLLDPAAGLIATANSFLPVPQPEWFEGDFDTPFRAERIREQLALRTDWSVESLAALEGDTRSLWARRLIGALGDGYAGDAGRARAVLAAWDGEMAGSGAPALFVLLERALQRAAFEDEATRAAIPRFGTRWRLLNLLEGRMSETFWDDVSTPAVEGRQAILDRALGAAWRQGVERWGEDLERWRYTETRRLTFDHPLGSLPVVGRWWNRGPFAVDGSATSILAFGGPWRGEVQEVAYGPSMRLVSDAADPDRTLVVMPGGQSGHPGDPHYDDQIADYLENRPRPFAWSELAIEAATVSRLRLVPESK